MFIAADVVVVFSVVNAGLQFSTLLLLITRPASCRWLVLVGGLDHCSKVKHCNGHLSETNLSITLLF